MNIGFQLFQLQGIDTEIDRSSKRLLQIAALLETDATVESARNNLADLRAKSEQIRSDFDLINQDIQQKKVKKSQSEASLYNGKVQNPKELQSLEMEIASLEKILKDLDQKLVEKLMLLDEAEAQESAGEADLKQAIAAFETSKSLLTAEKGNLETAIRNLNVKRTTYVAQIDQNALNTYETLRKAKNGLAVAQLQDDSCSACGSSLTASQCQQARSTSLLFLCPSCGRIVYGS
jgi:predicted  nucleic acid-binding Zn-ribbon protein